MIGIAIKFGTNWGRYRAGILLSGGSLVDYLLPTVLLPWVDADPSMRM